MKVVVAITMGRQHGLRGGLVRPGLPLEVDATPAAGLGCIAGEFDAIDGNHLRADESLAIADGEYGAEDLGDVLAQCTDEVGDGREVWPTIAGERDERDLVDTDRLSGADFPGTVYLNQSSQRGAARNK